MPLVFGKIVIGPAVEAAARETTEPLAVAVMPALLKVLSLLIALVRLFANMLRLVSVKNPAARPSST